MSESKIIAKLTEQELVDAYYEAEHYHNFEIINEEGILSRLIKEAFPDYVLAPDDRTCRQIICFQIYRHISHKFVGEIW